jgi:hypothetical protein
MTFRSKLIILLALSLTAFVVGCGTGDTGTPAKEVVNKEAAAQKQAGQGGRKAAMGGGIDEGVVPAPAGVQTGPMVGGHK